MPINAPVTLRFVVDDGQSGNHYDHTLNTSVFNFAADWNATATPLYGYLHGLTSFVSARIRLTVMDQGYSTPNQIYPYNPAPKSKVQAVIGISDLTTLAAFKTWGDDLFTVARNLATPF